MLFSSRAPIDYIAIAGIQMATNQGFKNFICNEKILTNGFLYYFLRFRTKFLQSLGRGATFTEISRDILSKVEISVPPLATQKQIVERLDKIARAQKLNDGLIQKTDELFQSLLHKELNPVRDSKHSNGVNPPAPPTLKLWRGKKNWEIKKMVDLINPQYGYTTSAKDSGNYRFIRITDIGNEGELRDSDKKYVTISQDEAKAINYEMATCYWHGLAQRSARFSISKKANQQFLHRFDSSKPQYFNRSILHLVIFPIPGLLATS